MMKALLTTILVAVALASAPLAQAKKGGGVKSHASKPVHVTPVKAK